MMREQHESFGKQLREIILNNNPSNSKNMILSGHGGTLEIDKNLVIDIDQTHNLERDETGFVVIENVNGKLYARHTFSSIRNYVNASITLN